METKSVTGQARSSNKSSSNPDSNTRQDQHAREEWLNQWSHMWTKRQNPEWKPRRASVATCQQQQQQQQRPTKQQDKQRKCLIFSMALRRMIAESDLTSPIENSTKTAANQADCFQPSGFRSRGCSFNSQRSPSHVSSGTVPPPAAAATAVVTTTAAVPTTGTPPTMIKSISEQPNQQQLQQQQQVMATTTDSRMVLSSSRSMLIDRLQAERAAASASTNQIKSTTGPSGAHIEQSTPTTTTTRTLRKYEQETIDKTVSEPKQTKQPFQGAKRAVPAQRSASASSEGLDERIAVMRQLVISGASTECDDLDNPTSDRWQPTTTIATDQHSPTGSCDIEQESASDDDDDDEAADDDCQLMNRTRDRWGQMSAKENDCATKRSLSVQSKEMSDALSAQISCPSHDLEELIVESWLDDHPEFANDYFMRKASRQLIDDWLIAHAKVNNSNLSSQLDLRPLSSLSRPISQQSLEGSLRGPLWRVPGTVATTNEISEPSSASIATSAFAFGRSARSDSQSGGNHGHGSVAPVRKISATDFESRSGSGFLRPMLSTTPDGRLTFLTQNPPTVVNEDGESKLIVSRNKCDQSSNESNTDAVKSASNSMISQEFHDNERQQQQLHQQLQQKQQQDVSDNKISDEGEEESETEEAEDELVHDNGEVKLIFELVKNICNDLDIRTLLHKILKNIAVLINADKSSLFLVCGEQDDQNRHLVSQLFNVDQDSADIGEANDCITIPWGTGLVGYVAKSGESLNIANCYDDPRFTNAIDQRTGYVTKHMLCAPIFDKRNEIVGVAQVINKRDGKPFSRSDEIKFNRYLQFCGIGLRNAQSYEHCQLENKRNQVLLDLARMVFEEQSTIEQVVYRIMLHTQSLLECQRCQVLLIDDGSDELDQLLQLPNSTSALQRGSTSQLSSAAVAAAIRSPPDSKGYRLTDWRPQCHVGRCDDRCDSATNEPGPLDDGRVAPEVIDETGEGHSEYKSMAGEKQQRQQQLSSKLFSLVFDLESDGDDPIVHCNKGGEKLSSTSRGSPAGQKRRRQLPINIGITGYVAVTGETLNIEDAHRNERFDPSVDEGSDFRHKSVLCMPIRNGQRQIIGVSQLINKKNGRPFNKNDEDLFEAFAIFCGLGIHNTLMYERVLKIMAKQRVTFEVLSYHATAPLEEAKKLHLEQIPSCFALNLASLKFNDFSLDDQYMLKSCLRFFLDLDLIRRFQIDQLVFCNWILSVQKNYRKVTYHPIVDCYDPEEPGINNILILATNRPLLYLCSRAILGGSGLKASPVRYHNWRHAFNVSQMMFAILVNTQICQALGELETLALLIACLCHDLDHRGTNNSFQIKSASPLAELYSTSTMEHHHFDQCVMILNSQGNQILANLTPAEYSRVIALLEEAILATDLANYFQKRDLFFQLVNSNQFDWQANPDHRSLLRCMLMTGCDVAAITKPWPVQKVVADLVMSEFYQQGDIEKNELKLEPIDMMNRDKMNELPEMQISFIDTICAPIYTALAKLFPNELKPLLDGCLSNRDVWAQMAKNNVEQQQDRQQQYHDIVQMTSYLGNDNDRSIKLTQPIPLPSSISKSDLSIYYKTSENKLKDEKIPLDLNNPEVLLPFETSCKPHDVQPSSACECQISKLDCQRKSI